MPVARPRISLPVSTDRRPRRTARDAARPAAPDDRPGRARAPCRGSTRRWPCPPPASLPGVLPSSCGGALDIKKIVDDLEGKPEIVRIGRERRAHGLARLAQDGARHAGEGDQRAGLEPLQMGDSADRHVRALLLGQQVEHLAADHAVCAHGLGEFRLRVQPAPQGRHACPRAPAPRRPTPAGRRRPGLPSPRRTACDTRVCRAGDHHRPSPADRRGSANRRARIQWHSRSWLKTTQPP